MNRLLRNEDETRACAAALAGVLVPGMVFTFEGELGAGKTAFVRATLRALGETGAVKSPTYALIETYAFTAFEIHHIDFYRLEHPLGWRGAGLEECFAANAIVFIEWPSKAAQLPVADIAISMTVNDDETRAFAAVAHTEIGVRIVAAWSKAMST